VLYAVVSSATFGLIPLFSIPLLHAGMASPTILFYRMLLSAAIMAAVALLLKRNFRISRRDFGVLAGLSLMYAATSLGLLRSYDYIPSGVATTVNFLYPLVVTIVMTLFFRERSSVWIVIAVFISLVGVALLAWGDAGNNDPGRGLIYAGTTVFTYAVYIIGVMKSRAGRLDPLIVAFYVLTFSAAVFLVYALSTSGIAVVHTWHIWRNLLLLALLPTVLSNLTLVLAIKHIGSTMTSILGSMEPLTAVLGGGGPLGGGACRDYIPQAIAQGCDTFVTADLRYNDFLDTRGLNLIDAGHYPTENVVCEAVRAYLARSFPLLEVVRSASHHDAIQYYL